MKRLPVVIVLFLVLTGVQYLKKQQIGTPTETGSSTEIEQAYNDRLEDVQVKGGGRVVKLLPDDLDGSKHQKFIVAVNSNLTVLISHNIDLAPRVKSLKHWPRRWRMV